MRDDDRRRAARESSSSSHSMPSMSRWLVGSSSSSTSGSSATRPPARHACVRPRRGPSVVAVPSSPKRCRYSTMRASTRQRARSSSIESSSAQSARDSRRLGAAGSSGSWRIDTTRTPLDFCISPSSSAMRPAITSSSDDLPVPLRPISPTRSPGSRLNSARSRRGWVPKASSARSRVSSDMEFEHRTAAAPVGRFRCNSFATTAPGTGIFGNPS